ncbi:hypothetical protein BCR43DRAFT_499285 [Syncephalastrum racemosum]|uniref:Uncharacterized protein n=1 Tax=Syncephalastrum racemosum TaxID=13706 RepID=A0A1X2H040_SYNRA|nr:hypothetical protein BCR43DRAFT_499285 [Syncephalastrum racemosum]
MEIKVPTDKLTKLHSRIRQAHHCVRQGGSNDPGCGRGTSTHPFSPTRSREKSSRKTRAMGSSMSSLRRRPRRIRLSAKQPHGSSGFTRPPPDDDRTSYLDLGRHIRQQVEDQFEGSKDAWPLDKGRERKVDQYEGTADDPICITVPHQKICGQTVELESDNMSALKYAKRSDGAASAALRYLALQIQQVTRDNNLTVIYRH